MSEEVTVELSIHTDNPQGRRFAITLAQGIPMGTDVANRAVRGLILAAANAAARSYPDPVSKYSDDLVKEGRISSAGIIQVDRKRDPDPDLDESDWGDEE